MERTLPVIDLHCDLLSYLAAAGPERTPYDPVSRASYPQLSAGGVKLQTLAIFTETLPKSTHLAEKQIESLLKLPLENPTHFAHYSSAQDLGQFSEKIHLIPAFENASSFAEESEPLHLVLQRLDIFHKLLKKIFYITMTWNTENRFGGGNNTTIGLKDDGKKLLDWMSGKQIAIDFSHTSDRLAEEILSHIDRFGLELPVIASHSNFREISPYPRNLPGWLAQEIIRRKGLIGLNFFAPFIRKDDPSALVRHVEYALDLGAHDVLSFGADFFFSSDYPALMQKYQITTPYFPAYADASCYPFVLELFGQILSLSTDQLQKIASDNALAFLKRLYG